jgi:membrane associated rhomboid family serine protease
MNSPKRLLYSLSVTGLLLLIPWALEISFALGGPDWKDFGLRPRDFNGLWGILTMSFLHSGFQHLLSNSIPFLVLGSALFYFYRESSWKVLGGILLGTGLILWFIGRYGTNHIGASGLVYGLVAFHLTSGMIRKNRNLMAFSLLVVFLYGGFIWSIFPDFFPDQNISWEGHLAGIISGIVMAVLCRRCGPAPDPVMQDEEVEEVEIVEEVEVVEEVEEVDKSINQFDN